ncbi:securin isoform X2 [Synchiropus splendidus]|nr:securin isoform X2 [Synchiropus splendidus]XP_053734515.1 securin isoform X2 [Synchiropus splendidus]
MAGIYVHQENARLRVPSLKMRRLQSASDMPTKSPHPSGRKALQVMSNNASTPAVHLQGKKLIKPQQETKVKTTPQIPKDEYPEIEGFHPYDPSEYLKQCVPEDVMFIGDPHLTFEPSLDVLDDKLDLIIPELSPLPSPDLKPELDAFLLTLDELTIDLPPEPVAD